MAPKRYAQIIEAIFFSHSEEGVQEIEFDRSEIVQAAKELQIALPKNLGDVIHSFRYRTKVPDSIRATASAGLQRTTVPGMGQVETDKVYIGLDTHGAHYVLPVQAKDGTDKIDIVQIEQDIALCQHRFPGLLCRPVAAQLMSDQLIALFELQKSDTGIAIALEKHYRLVWQKELSLQELARYQLRPF